MRVAKACRFARSHIDPAKVLAETSALFPWPAKPQATNYPAYRASPGQPLRAVSWWSPGTITRGSSDAVKELLEMIWACVLHNRLAGWRI